MTFICLLRGCLWRAMSGAGDDMDCECCQRCGALRYHLVNNPRS